MLTDAGVILLEHQLFRFSFRILGGGVKRSGPGRGNELDDGTHLELLSPRAHLADDCFHSELADGFDPLRAHF